MLKQFFEKRLLAIIIALMILGALILSERLFDSKGNLDTTKLAVPTTINSQSPQTIHDGFPSSTTPKLASTISVSSTPASTLVQQASPFFTTTGLVALSSTKSSIPSRTPAFSSTPSLFLSRTPTLTKVVVSRTQSSVPTVSATSTSTLTVTATVSVTLTRTMTPTVAVTPTPTATPTIDGLFTGSGNQKIDLAKWKTPAILAIDYSGPGGFEVISYDIDGEPLSTLIDVTGAYKGKLALNFGGVSFSAIEILTSGNWKIQILPLSTAPLLNIPGNISGTNSNVFALYDLLFNVTLDATNATDWVGVIGYGDNGYIQTLIDGPAPFNGSVSIADPEIKYLEINIVGPWSLTVK